MRGCVEDKIPRLGRFRRALFAQCIEHVGLVPRAQLDRERNVVHGLSHKAATGEVKRLPVEWIARVLVVPRSIRDTEVPRPLFFFFFFFVNFLIYNNDIF
jgi:hypothetical protein